MNKFLYFIPTTFFTFAFAVVSCGNPIIEDEYGKVSGLGDNKLYIIKTFEDIAKIHAHLDGTFVFDLDDDLEMDAKVTGVFTGKLQGMGTGKVLVAGSMFEETDGAVIKDIVFVQNGAAERGANNVGIVTGAARNTKFINVRVEGSISTSRTAGMSVCVGGIAGRMDAGSVITRSSSEAGVNSPQGSVVNIGGLVGFNEGGEISYSYSHGQINGGAEDTINAGGLAGYSSGRIFDSYYALTGGIVASAPTTTTVGGLVGDSSAGTLENSYSSAGAGVTAAAGSPPSETPNVHPNPTTLDASSFNSNPSYWSFGPTFQDGDAGGATAGAPVQILPRLINNPDRFTGPWK